MDVQQYQQTIEKIIKDLSQKADNRRRDSAFSTTDILHARADAMAFAYNEAVWTIKNELAMAKIRSQK